MASGLVCGFSCVVILMLSIGCRLCYWDSGRCRDSCKCSAIEIIRRTHFNIDLWLSSCSLRAHRLIDFGNLIIPFYLSYLQYNFSILEIIHIYSIYSVSALPSVDLSRLTAKFIFSLHFYPGLKKTNSVLFL